MKKNNETDNLPVVPEERVVTTWLTNHYIHAATSDNTRKAYRSDIRHYEQWSGLLPATPEMITQYLENYAEKLNARTLARRLIALKHWHTYQGFPDPTIHPAVTKTLAGILRIHGKPKTKAHALTVEEVTQIASYLQQDGSLAAIRDQAILLVGFFGALRRSELIAIKFEHLNWQEDGVEILLPSSKTDQLHEGQYCVLPPGIPPLCPLNALKNWLDRSQITSGYLFRRILQNEQIGLHPLAPLSINHILKNRAKATGMTHLTHLSSHSMRRGLATCAARAGTPLHAIMRAGRWKQTNTVIEYIEASERFTENAAANVLEWANKKE